MTAPTLPTLPTLLTLPTLPTMSYNSDFDDDYLDNPYGFDVNGRAARNQREIEAEEREHNEREEEEYERVRNEQAEEEYWNAMREHDQEDDEIARGEFEDYQQQQLVDAAFNEIVDRDDTGSYYDISNSFEQYLYYGQEFTDDQQATCRRYILRQIHMWLDSHNDLYNQRQAIQDGELFEDYVGLFLDEFGYLYPVVNPIDEPVDDPIDGPVDYPIEGPVDNIIEGPFNPVDDQVDGQVWNEWW